MKYLILLFPLFLACQGPKPSQSVEIKAEETIAVSYTLAVDGMTCTGCENTVQNAVKRLNGVTSVEASHESGLITLSVNPEIADTTAIRESITNSGYMPAGYFNLTE